MVLNDPHRVTALLSAETLRAELEEARALLRATMEASARERADCQRVRGIVGMRCRMLPPACDGCHREYHRSLLTPIGEGYLHVCPACLPQALATVRTPSARAPWNPAHLAVISHTTTAA